MKNMKKIYILIAVFFGLLSFGQDTDQNYSKKITYKKPTSQGVVDITNPANAIIEVTYYDGLGRPIQNIAHKQSNSGKDIITHILLNSDKKTTLNLFRRLEDVICPFTGIQKISEPCL